MPPTASFENQSATISVPGGFGTPTRANKRDGSLPRDAPVFTPSKVYPPLGATRSEGALRVQQHAEGVMEEVIAGAQWWTSSMMKQGLTQGQVDNFERSIAVGILQRCEGHWYPEEPMRGSGYRSVVNYHKGDPLLIAAGESAHIKDVCARLPKACVWVNPGGVRVQVESERHACTVFSTSVKNTPNKKGSASGSGSDTD